MTDHAELRRLAGAATPGARYQGTDERVIVAGNGTIICTVSGAISGPSVMADAEFLCATDPNTILSLLNEIAENDSVVAVWRGRTRRAEDEIDRLKAENEELRGALQAVVDDPTWRSNDNTLWPKIIKAMDKGAKQ
ncbi:hypothetical protein [Pseudomonas aeruginosa]|uniref:hypothetical protein n=1 Tax=Pseudomonas aeruginosa TaxID=287 RepID=UPI00038086E7|nr:hypothetical protein [Pseudomonas aeruginosa]